MPIRSSSTFLLCSSLLAVAAVWGCKPGPVPGAETGLIEETGDDFTGDGDGDGDGDPTTGDGDGDDPPGCANELDILFVLDNSGSMGGAQVRLVDGIAGLIGPLDEAGVDWRIGVTTTDNGNMWCPAGTTTPEGGKLVFSSCRTRLGDFLFGDAVDDQDRACNDICELAEVETIATATEVDPMLAPRPWVQSIDGQTNLANGIGVIEALSCLLPQGVNGCGFESQLESAYLALARAQNNAEESYGFLRDAASLLVVIVSDEVDCSANPDWSAIFSPDGNKVFWSDPGSGFPTSAVCWNAGVACTGDPSQYASCDPQGHDVNGDPIDDPINEVLRPLSRYTGLLDGLEAEKKVVAPDAAVQLAVIGGVGLDGTITYAESPDPSVQSSFGIGTTCEDGTDVAGLPIVRMRDVANATGGELRSICEPNYGAALTAIVTPFLAACG